MYAYRFLLPLLCLPLCTGCIHIEEWMTLKSDGSGKVKISFAFPKLGLRFLPGKPDANWFKPNLPKNVLMDSFNVQERSIPFKNPQGQTQQLEGDQYTIELAFEDVSDLNQVRVLPDKRNELAAMAGNTPGKDDKTMMMAKKEGPKTGPFQQVEFKKIKNGLFKFRRVIQAAKSKQEIDQAKLGGLGNDTSQQSYDLQDSKIQIVIESPTQVVEHNATKLEGKKLTWIFKLNDLQEKLDRDWTVEFTCKAEATQ